MQNTTSPARVTVLGLGLMGTAIAANLAEHGFDVRGWNRTAGRAAGLAEQGVEVPAGAAEATAALAKAIHPDLAAQIDAAVAGVKLSVPPAGRFDPTGDVVDPPTPSSPAADDAVPPADPASAASDVSSASDAPTPAATP